MNTSQSIMNDQHRATDLEWYCIKSRICDAHNSGVVAYSTIHELLNRIEALEAAAQPNHPAKPDSSLMQRVAAVIDNGAACDRAPERIARDSIREVAAWLRKNYGGPTETTYLLEEEAVL